MPAPSPANRSNHSLLRRLLRNDRSGWSPLKRVFIYSVFTGLSLVCVLPLFITVFASFKNIKQVISEFPLLPPASPIFGNYTEVFLRGDIPRGLLNSVVLVVTSVVINTFLTSMVAYCLSRFEFRFKKIYFLLLMFGMLMPTIVIEVARFGVIKSIGVYDSMLAPVLIYSVIDMMQIYIYLQFMEKIPIALDESALIDGSSYPGIYFRIIFPLTMPATATLAIIKMIDIMNDMFIPYLYMPSTRRHTLTTALMYLTGDRGPLWTTVSAAIIVVMLPTVILYLILNKYIFKGIVAGAVKG